MESVKITAPTGNRHGNVSYIQYSSNWISSWKIIKKWIPAL